MSVKGPRVGLFVTCLVDLFRPTVGFAAVKLLEGCFKGAGRQVTFPAGDGFAGLKAILPPPTRRALVLIDPSYETRDDYVNVVKGLQEALKRLGWAAAMGAATGKAYCGSVGGAAGCEDTGLVVGE